MDDYLRASQQVMHHAQHVEASAKSNYGQAVLGIEKERKHLASIYISDRSRVAKLSALRNSMQEHERYRNDVRAGIFRIKEATQQQEKNPAAESAEHLQSAHGVCKLLESKCEIERWKSCFRRSLDAALMRAFTKRKFAGGKATPQAFLKEILEQRKRTSNLLLSQSASQKIALEKAQVLEDLQETLFPSDGSLSSVTAFAALSASRTKTFESAEERLRSKLSASSSAVDAGRQRFVASQSYSSMSIWEFQTFFKVLIRCLVQVVHVIGSKRT